MTTYIKIDDIDLLMESAAQKSRDEDLYEIDVFLVLDKNNLSDLDIEQINSYFENRWTCENLNLASYFHKHNTIVLRLEIHSFSTLAYVNSVDRTKIPNDYEFVASVLPN